MTDVDERDEHGWSALDRAAGAGELAAVQDLVTRGADPAGSGPDGRGPYDIALAAGHTAVARYLADAQDRVDPDAAQRRRWRPYCKAYLLGELRRFPAWPSAAAADESDDTVVYLHDDLSVTLAAFPGEHVLLVGDIEGWASFCDELGFVVPDELALSEADES